MITQVILALNRRQENDMKQEGLTEAFLKDALRRGGPLHSLWVVNE